MSEVARLPAPRMENWQWQTSAACRGMSDSDFFSPERERGQAKRNREAAAKTVCRSCPVIENCLDWALTVQEPYGIWGGLNADQRAELINARTPLARAE